LSEKLIRKTAAQRQAANMPDYDAARRELDWDTFRSWLDYLPGGGLNIAYEAIDRHVVHGKGDREALRWLGKSGERKSYSYAELKTETDRFARLLANLGLGKGTRVYSLLGRVPELYIAALGTLKAGGVFCRQTSARQYDERQAGEIRRSDQSRAGWHCHRFAGDNRCAAI
jgi:acetyl-CoA synthetase